MDKDIQNKFKQLCSIKIMFPVILDEQAIEYKKKIGLVLAEIPEAQIQFTLMNMPPNLKNAS